ncbi:MAG: SDR family oxidoreductase [Candidatus Electrothrix sp. GW3-4]|uniref:SDR family oxidoreductase n=1 Tax=Candidatus Electrothrix sp. GW3-4 TaxID=3126740 RepID=UPI0030CEC47E
MSRSILLTGASGKFGRILTDYFLSNGDVIIAICRSEASFNSLQKNHASNENFFIFKIDLTSENAILEFIEKIGTWNIQPNCLINNARSAETLKIQSDGTVSRDNFMGELLLNVVVPYQLTIFLADKQLLKRVVNIGSMYGTVAATPSLYTDYITQSPLHYGVTKAALSHLTKELAVRLAYQDIQVNCIAFGGLEGRVDEMFKQRYATLCPQRRMLVPDDLTGPVDFLLSDASNGMTGATIPVDGGWTLW